MRLLILAFMACVVGLTPAAAHAHDRRGHHGGPPAWQPGGGGSYKETRPSSVYGGRPQYHPGYGNRPNSGYRPDYGYRQGHGWQPPHGGGGWQSGSGSYKENRPSSVTGGGYYGNNPGYGYRERGYDHYQYRSPIAPQGQYRGPFTPRAFYNPHSGNWELYYRPN